MKKLFIFSMIILFKTFALAQEIQLTFGAENTQDIIDSIIVLNQRSGQVLKLSCNDTLVLHKDISGIGYINENVNDGILYPNPTDGSSYLDYSCLEGGKIELAVYNSSGYLLGRNSNVLLPGNHRYRIMFPVNGFYLVALKRNHEVSNFKAICTVKNRHELKIEYQGGTYGISESPLFKKGYKRQQDMNFSKGDILHFTFYSGNMITVMADSPVTARDIIVNFYKCSDPDNRVYKTVWIGSQIWMAENLAYLPSVSPSSQGSDTTAFYYVNDYQGTDKNVAKATVNYKTYGVLYNSLAAMGGAKKSNDIYTKVKGVCPAGWHLPDGFDWLSLKAYLIESGYNHDGTTTENKIAKSLAAPLFWNSSSETGTVGNILSTNNRSGFSALPGGQRIGYNGKFEKAGYNAYWWSYAPYYNSPQETTELYYNQPSLVNYNYNKDYGLSVRCLSDIIRQQPDLPNLYTIYPSEVTSTSAKSGGVIYTDGGSRIIGRGLVWSRNEMPTLESNDGKTIHNSEENIYQIMIEGLLPNTTYYARAYAINTKGTAYGGQNSFKTTNSAGPYFGQLDDTRGGVTITYKTIKIGSQTWMAENLAYLPVVSPSSEGSNTTPYYYVYGYQGNDVNAAKATDYYNTYGVLYNWPAAMAGASSSNSNPSKVQGICPVGWHLPSYDEWKQLEMVLGMTQAQANTMGFRGTDQGTQLKATTGWSNVNGTNTSGFSALPGGFYYSGNSAFSRIRSGGYWWSSTDYNGSNAFYRNLDDFKENVNSDFGGKKDGLSVRCVKDN